MPQTKKKDKFVFWTPCEIEKGGEATNEKGDRIMKLKGIASTSQRDSDNEILDPEGFDLSFFKSSGLVNWHHQAKDKPLANIGEPEVAKIVPEGLWVECVLWNGSQLANDVYDLAELMEQNSETRRLGFSIEGKVLERNPLDENHITKARITGLAVTHIPKNPATLCEILKGDRDGFDMEWDDDEIEEDMKKTTAKKAEGDGIEEQAGNSEVAASQDDDNNEDGTGNGIEEAEKAMSTSSGVAVIKESLDGTLKPECLTKGQTFDRIFKDFPDIDIEKSKQVYQIIVKVSENMNNGKEKITNDAISKAYEVLGIPNPNNDINKAGGGFTSADSPSEAGMAAANGSKEAFFKDMGNGEYKKMYKGDAEDGSADTDADDKTYVKKGDEFVEKSETVVTTTTENDLNKGQTTDIGAAGGSVEIVKALGVIMGEQTRQNTEMFKAMGTVMQGFAQTQTQILEELAELRSLPAGGRRSVSNIKQIERFDKGEQNELNQNNQQNKNQLSLTQNRPQVLKLLNGMAFQKGEMNTFYANGLTHYEASGQLREEIREAIRSEKQIEFIA